jgi:hypothetical protein
MGDTPLYLQAHFREQVKDTFDTGIQQTVSKFSDAGIIDPDWKADQVVYRTGAQVTFVETTGQRGGDTQQGEWQAGFRSGFKRDFEAAVQLDRNDQRKLYTANLPTSEIQQEMQMAWHRKWDDVILDASRAPSLGGEKPYITPLALPSDLTIPVTWAKIADGATNTNLTYWKIAEALARMEVSDVDLDREMVTIYISPRMKQAWWAYAQAGTNELFAKLIAGWIQKPSEGLMGCKVVVTNRLYTSAGNVQAVIAAKRGFRMPPTSYEVEIDVLADKRHARQIAVYANTGAMRRYDELVKLIWCDPTAAIVV